MRSALVPVFRLVLLGVSSTAAWGDIRTNEITIPTNSNSEGQTTTPRGTFDDRNSGLRGVALNDRASVGVNITTRNGANTFVNSGGDFAIARGPTFTDLGAHRFGTGQVQAQWDEVINSGRTFINLAIRTSDQAQLIPANATVDGSAFATWNWRFGLGDAIDFAPDVASVELRSATAFYSRNFGRSFFSSQVFTAFLPTNFNPGRDPGISLVNAGDGTNFVSIRYEIDIKLIPAPSTAILLASGLLFLRRRRTV